MHPGAPPDTGTSAYNLGMLRHRHKMTPRHQARQQVCMSMACQKNTLDASGLASLISVRIHHIRTNAERSVIRLPLLPLSLRRDRRVQLKVR